MAKRKNLSAYYESIAKLEELGSRKTVRRTPSRPEPIPVNGRAEIGRAANNYYGADRIANTIQKTLPPKAPANVPIPSHTPGNYGPQIKPSSRAAFAQGTADVVQGLGGAANWRGYDKTATRMKEVADQMAGNIQPIPYAEWDGGKGLLNPNYYKYNIPRMAAFPAAFMAASIPMALGGEALAGAAGLGATGSTIAGGITAGLGGRALEGAVEAGQFYDETGDREKANEIWLKNQALAATDAYEYLAMFAPGLGPLAKAGKYAKMAGAVGKFGASAAVEGFEENYQSAVQNQARGDKRGLIDMTVNPDSWEEFAGGAMLGGLMTGPGAASEIAKAAKIPSKSKWQQAIDQLDEVNKAYAQGNNRGLVMERVKAQKAPAPVVEDKVKQPQRTPNKNVTMDDIKALWNDTNQHLTEAGKSKKTLELDSDARKVMERATKEGRAVTPALIVNTLEVNPSQAKEIFNYIDSGKAQQINNQSPEDAEVEEYIQKTRTVKPGKGKYTSPNAIETPKTLEKEGPSTKPIVTGDFTNGDIVVDKTGRKWTVADASDPSQLKVKSETGAETMVGRKAVSKEAANSVKVEAPKIEQPEVKAPKIETPVIPNKGKPETLVEEPKKVTRATQTAGRPLDGGPNWSQRASFDGKTVKVQSYLGKDKDFEYSFDVSEWDEAQKFGNPAYKQTELTKKYYKPENESKQIYNPEVDRLRDAQRIAIGKAIKDHRESQVKKEELPTTTDKAELEKEELKQELKTEEIPINKEVNEDAGNTNPGTVGRNSEGPELDVGSGSQLEGTQAENVPGIPSKGRAKADSDQSNRDNAGAGGPINRPAKAAKPDAKNGQHSGENTISQNDSPDGMGDSKGESIPSERRGPAESVKKDTRKLPGQNYSFTEEDTIDAGGIKTKYKNNIAAIELLKKLDAEGRLANPDEQAILAKYTGWGGNPQVFYRNYAGETHKDWTKEYHELKGLLTEEEYEAARSSTLNAHYTSETVIKEIWQAMEHLGFKGGRILEPSMGIGRFFGFIPKEIAGKSKLTGVELDSVTGRIAKQLFQKADIRVEGFEKTKIPDEYYDLAISNVPFADVQPNDPKYNKLKLQLHNYFFAKTMDKVRPGGIIAFITGSGTMQAGKDARTVRELLSNKADLLMAVRLPNTAFKGSANTQVTTDLIILQKREPGAIPNGESWINNNGRTEPVPVKWGNGTTRFPINEYYERHPEYLLGKITDDTLHPGRAALDSDGRDIGEALSEALNNLPENAYKEPDKKENTADLDNIIPAPGNLQEGTYIVKDGVVYQNQESKLIPVSKDKKILDKIKSLIEIRDIGRNLLRSQAFDDSKQTDIILNDLRKQLNTAYDKFLKKYGHLSEKKNIADFKGDPDAEFLLSLEELDTYAKAAIFTKRTIQPFKHIDKVETAKEALIVSLNEKGRVDMDRMVEVSAKSSENIIQELKGIIYLNPANMKWETSEEYLSDNVREKLAWAETAAESDERFQENIKALKFVQPVDIPYDEIESELGSPWIPTEDIEDFIRQLTGISRYHITPKVSHARGQWAVEFETNYPSNTRNYRDSVAVSETWGTMRAGFDKLLEKSLNLQTMIVYDTDSEGKRTVNPQQTLLAQEKQKEIKAKFKEWLWENEERRSRLSRLYNDTMNNLRLSESDGSHLEFPGMNVGIKLRPHQKNAVWRIITKGNTLLAHVVGAGKTWTMQAAGMELKRLGIAKKPAYVVPAHMLNQFTHEFKELYPHAKLLIVSNTDLPGVGTKKSKKDTESSLSIRRDENVNKRKITLNRIATGDWDGVVLTYPTFQKIPMSPEWEASFIREEIETLRQAITEIKAAQGKDKDSRMVKELEKTLLREEAKLNRNLDDLKRDMAIPFEELGIDQIFVDEADNFKNLQFVTKMTRVAGLGQPKALRAFDMFLKTQWLTRMNNGRGVVFATGTPISNTMSEMFTLKRYLGMDELKARGLDFFDSWAGVFGRTVTGTEMTPDGSGYRQNTRFAKFVNAPEMIQMFRTFADVQMNKDNVLGLKIPTMRTGQPITLAAERSEALEVIIYELAERSLAIKNRDVDSSVDNMLKVTTDGRKAALDVRLYDPSLPEDPESKINIAVNQIAGIWERTKENRSTQLLFCDLSAPKSSSDNVKEDEVKEENTESAVEEAANLQVYVEIKKKLMRAGIPSKEIAFIHDAKTDKQKYDLQQKVVSGEIRVMLGSTEKMGAGLNVQKKLIAIHELTPPWRPRDFQQAEGRIIRQGNDNKEVEVFRYVTKKSFDVYMWQTLVNKAKFIAQALSGDLTTRTFEDTDPAVLSAGAAMAIASDNPLQIEKADVAAELFRLSQLKSGFASKMRKIQKELLELPQSIESGKGFVQKITQDIAARKDISGDRFSITLEGKKYDKRADADEALDKIKAKSKTFSDTEKEEVGKIAGFGLLARRLSDGNLGFYLIGPGDYEYGVSTSSITGIEHTLRNSPERWQEYWTEKGQEKEKTLADLKVEAQNGFKFDDEMKRLEKRLEEIDTEMGVNDGDSSLASVEAEGAERINDTIPEGRPSLGGTIQMVGATAGEAFNGDFKFEDPEVEARMSAAEKGFKPEAILNKVRLAIQTFRNKWTREFEHLPRGAFWSKARFALSTLLKGDAIASKKSLDLLQAVVVKLKKNEFKAFSRKVVMENTAENYRLYLEEVDGQENPEPFIFPYGIKDEVQFRKELSRLNDYLEKAKRKDKDGNLVSFALDAYDFRQRMMREVTQNLISAAKDIGVNKEKKYNRKNYFRQQVLELMKEEGIINGTGSKVRTKFRGHEQKRDVYGTEHDYSANYLQAEYEVMSKMLFDIQLFKTIKVMKDNYDVMESLKLQALKENDAKILDYFRELLSDPQIAEIAGTDDAEKFYRIVLNTKQARGFSALFALAANGELPEGPNGKFEELIEEMAKAYLLNKEAQSNADEVADGIHVQASLPKEYYKQLFKYLNYILKEHGGSAESGAAALIYRGMAEKKSTIKNTLGRKFKTWKELIPKGYAEWTPNPGTSFYTAYSLSEKKAQEIFEDAMQQVGVNKSDLRKVHVAGQKKVMVIPQELADTLNKLTEVKSRGFVGKVMKGWKVWQLLMPKRLIKYNVRNFPGDLEKSLHNPKSLLKAPKAAWDLAQVFFRNRAIPPEMKPFVDRGGFEAGLYIQDLGDINRVKAFLHVMDEKSLWQKTYNFPVNFVKGYWFNVKNFTSWREAVLRYANFLEYVEQIEGNKGKPKNFGASVREEVMALGDKYDMAYKLSNDLIGAYDATSVYGQEIREKIIPFWSFQEANMKSFKQLVINASRDDKLARTVGIKLAGTLVLRSPFWAWRMGKLGIKIMGFFAITQIYNMWRFPDEEEDLPIEVRSKPHIIFGRNPDGTIDYFDRLGVLGDALEWFGLDETPKDVSDYLNGRRTLKEIGLDMVKSPVNKVIGSSTPLWKLPAELIAGKAAFPNAFKPGTIRDRWEYTARSFELDEEYKAITGKPGVPYWSKANFKKWIGYNTDPKLNAYYSILDAKYRYMKKIGKGTGESTGKKTEAMRNYRLALRYSDQKAAEKYLTEYYLAGGTERGYNQSLETSHPLSFLNEEERAAFTDSLSVDDLGKLAKAIELYEEVWMPVEK